MVKMMLVFLVALVLSTNPVKATDCVSVFASISPCKSYLANSHPVLPGTQCCDAATNVVSMADTESLCQCLRQSPISSSFIPSKAQQLPSLCNLNSFVPHQLPCPVWRERFSSAASYSYSHSTAGSISPSASYVPASPCVSVSDSPSGPVSRFSLSRCPRLSPSRFPRWSPFQFLRSHKSV
ncbi:UNVERIFIED_CONTAM: hypothetical protein Slati_2019800 [Sesamum latifolium]|uniref:Bifunctional inhibitor/plant lipid transfer protein/seed storage helical domain-containing protein n=1 Tax=Sesamum latifolium TaxID=2727402 RepID=A0AAW2WNW0_9LAMI